MIKSKAQARAEAELSRRIVEQAAINKVAEREAIRKEAAKLVNWLHR